MIKIDLITGFLGAGKTTFLKKYAEYFLQKGQKIGILENDYGAVNVDLLLLNDLRGENCELEMVAGGCDADCHRRRFKTKLIAMGMSGYDRVLIEPSGIFDMDEFFDALHEEPLDRWYEIGNVIAIVDARLEDDLSDISDFYLASQIADAGMIVLSRTQLADENQIEAVKKHLKRAAETAKIHGDREPELLERSWEELDADDFERIANAGYCLSSYTKLSAGQKNGYSTVYFLELPMNRKTIEEKTGYLMQQEDFGRVLRIKGFFQEEGKWYEINATKRETKLQQITTGQEVLIVIGEHLQEEKIREYMENR